MANVASRFPWSNSIIINTMIVKRSFNCFLQLEGERERAERELKAQKEKVHKRFSIAHSCPSTFRLLDIKPINPQKISTQNCLWIYITFTRHATEWVDGGRGKI
jgi:hypothetical protein